MRVKLLVLGVFLGLAGSLTANPISLNFEGITSYPQPAGTISINGFYNGGTASNGVSGTNYGVEFSNTAILLCMNTLALHCSSTSKGGEGVAGSEFYAMYFPNANPIMNVAAGFDTGFAMAYTNPFAATVGIEIWSGLNGTGSLLASTNLATTTNGINNPACLNSSHCNFANISLAFQGIAKSVVLTGSADLSAYDDLTFGGTVVGANSAVPEPSTLLLSGLGLAAVGLIRRRQSSR